MSLSVPAFSLGLTKFLYRLSVGVKAAKACTNTKLYKTVCMMLELNSLKGSTAAQQSPIKCGECWRRLSLVTILTQEFVQRKEVVPRWQIISRVQED